ncbi:hypothetical protein F5J12DRAFT_893966 [Pisolithus orientalis]|uniref:uncharacterized protein n=1 Tax=Pisolithus orientalis TaxID=936130 RepID=UPI002224309F|nr:uncharacterized protein F5J12DRAFT_893966 [Pisolithus orientalis]KAI6002569.1 hypothetical protein F5J12DRAFT_893966 [Pisolithus orientalis]
MANRCIIKDNWVKFNNGMCVPQMDELMYQLIDKWMARDRRRREEQQAPIICIEHEEEPPMNVNIFIAVHNSFQCVKRARIKEYALEGEDMAKEVISEIEYEVQQADVEQAFVAAWREENKLQWKAPKFDGVAVPGKERCTVTMTAEQAGPSQSGSMDAPEASLKDKGQQLDRSADQDVGRKGYRYMSLFKDPTAVTRVLNQYLGQTITIPGRDLLTISPDVWREFKD